LAEVIKQTYPECPLITVSETGVEDTKLAADDRVALSDGAAALVRAVMKAASQVAAREEDVHLSRKSMAP
jgi:hypothetical protein